MNEFRWKKSLTIWQATLYVNGIKHEVDAIEVFKAHELLMLTEALKHPDRPTKRSKGFSDAAACRAILSNIRAPLPTMSEDVEFYESLILLYIELFNDVGGGDVNESKVLCIDLEHRHISDSGKQSLSDKATFTKQSLAQWLYNAGDIEKANILVPNFIPDLVDNTTEINSLQIQNKKLLEEVEQLKAAKNKPQTAQAKESSKPYQLIDQLITIILPDCDKSKAYQIHTDLSRKLKGDVSLAVSEPTLKNYLDKT